MIRLRLFFWVFPYANCFLYSVSLCLGFLKHTQKPKSATVMDEEVAISCPAIASLSWVATISDVAKKTETKLRNNHLRIQFPSGILSKLFGVKGLSSKNFD